MRQISILVQFQEFQWRPGVFNGEVMLRVWWLWFALGYFKIPFKDFAETKYIWTEVPMD